MPRLNPCRKREPYAMTDSLFMKSRIKKSEKLKYATATATVNTMAARIA